MSSIEVCIRMETCSHKITFSLARRGIPAQPILNGYCGSYELGMPRSMINHPAFNYEHPIWNDTTTTTAQETSTEVTTMSAMQEALIEDSTVPSSTVNCYIGCTFYTIIFLCFIALYYKK